MNLVPNWLKKINIWRVALVDRPANPDAVVVLHKADNRKATEVDQTPEPDDDDLPQGNPKYGDEDDVEKAKCEKCDGDHATADHDAMMAKEGPGLSDVHTPAGDIHKKEVIMETQADREQVTALKKQLEVERSDKEALVARLEKVEGQQRHERYIAKVKRFNYLPGLVPDDFATIFAKIDGALSEPEREKFDKLMTATNAALRQSALFAEYGATGHARDGTEPEAKIEALVKSAMEKDPKLTRGKAYQEVMKANPQLYSEYLVTKKEARS